MIKPKRRLAEKQDDTNWTLMSIDGKRVTRQPRKAPAEQAAIPKWPESASVFGEWHSLGEEAMGAIRMAWSFFCNDLDDLVLKGEDVADQEAVIAMLDEFYAGLVKTFGVKDPVSVAAVITGDMGYELEGARAILSVVVQEQIATIDLARRLQSGDVDSGPPRNLWEERNGMVGAESRKRETMRLLRKHRMLRHRE